MGSRRGKTGGKYRRTRLFVFTLGYSRKSVRLLAWKSSTRIWAELHERAFRRLGGATAVVVHDNLREGVITPDIYDPALNPLYRDVLAHYGVVALPCRVRDPDRKGKVESGVGHAQRTPLAGMRFDTIEEGQAYLDRWESNWADTRIHGTTKRQVLAMFAEEKPHLRELPVEPFRYYQYGERTGARGEQRVSAATTGVMTCAGPELRWQPTRSPTMTPARPPALHLVATDGAATCSPAARPTVRRLTRPPTKTSSKDSALPPSGTARRIPHPDAPTPARRGRWPLGSWST